MFAGKSKPHSVEEFMEDFVEEINYLIEDGIQIGDETYNFELKGVICDTPARAFIKCCKGHTGFNACERCETHGISVGPKGHKKRIYPEIDAALRTKESFAKQDTGHHLPGLFSPLLRIKKFNIINGVFLDNMHLLTIGVMKSIMDKWIQSHLPCGLPITKKLKLKEILNSLKQKVPCEFQRKVFDLDNFANWKATQFRAILLYYGGIISRFILPKEQHQHFLLLYTACRILNHEKLARSEQYIAEAEKYLIHFFVLLPTYYGEGSQVMNFHNLIHLADDVRYMGAPLSYYSAFPFENCLGGIKRLVRTPVNPLAQIVARFSEMEGGHDLVTKNHALFSVGCDKKKTAYISSDGPLDYKSIMYKGYNLTVKTPDNVVYLADGNVSVIRRIFLNNENLAPTSENISISGHIYKNVRSALTYPRDSKFMGVLEIESKSRIQKTYSLSDINVKCILFDVNEKIYAVTLLHE